MGYYAAECDVSFEKLEKKNKIKIQLVLGEPIRIDVLALVVKGDALSDPAFKALGKNAPIKEKDIFHHGKYEQLKENYLNAALARGYFDAEFKEKKVNVSLEKKTASITLLFDSGKRYRISSLVITGSLLREAIFHQRLPFKMGDYYTADELAQYRLSLIKTGYFSQVKINPDFEKVSGETLPLKIEVIMQSRRTLKVGLGYATDVGPRVSFGWRQPWVSDKGHSVLVETKLSAKKNILETRYQIPVLNDFLQYYEIGAAHKTDDILNTKTSSLNFQKVKNFESGWTMGRFIKLAKDEFINDGLEDVSISIVPGIYFEAVSKDGTLIINEGNLKHYELDTSARAWGSDHDYLRLTGLNRWIKKVSKENRLISRFQWGAVVSESEVSDLPETVRFRAGGDHSVRGFSFESLGVTNQTSGLLEGGRYLVAGSVEYEKPLIGRWRVAFFADSGSAFTNKIEAKTAIGSGIRWYSPLGPIRLDVAYPLDFEKNIRFHLTMGPEF